MALTKVPSNLDAAVSTTQSASDNSTNVATTAYVTTAIANLSDSAPAALNTLNEIAAALGDDANYASTTTAAIAAKAPLASPSFTGTVQLLDTNFPDNRAARFGSSQDLQIYHDGSNSHVKNTGSLYVASETSGDLYLRSDDDIFIQPQGGENGIKVIGNGAVQLYYDSSVKLETTTNGISTKGTSSNLITTSSTANDRAGAGFTATESATDGDRRATMYLDADNGAFSTGDSGAYFYMEKIGGGGEVNFINQDTSGYNFQTGGAHKRMVIGSSGKTSWSAGGIGTVATQDRDFTFYTEGGTNGIDIRSNDYRNILLGAGGSSGSAVDAGYIGIYKDGSTKIALNANGNSYFDGGNVGIAVNDPDARLEIKSAGGGSESALKVTDASDNKRTSFN